MKTVHIVVGEWGDHRSIDRVFSDYATAMDWAAYRRKYKDPSNPADPVIYSVESFRVEESAEPMPSVRKAMKQALSEASS